MISNNGTIACGLFTIAIAGCAGPHAHRHELDQFGKVYFVDGAGGGGVLTNKGAGVRVGLKAAGYPGDFKVFVWNTGLGVFVDQLASVKYKRQKAAQLAKQIVAYVASHPQRPVNVIAQSAGTAIAAFTLEALPEDHPVENVVLLASALSSHYDLTKALRRVRNRLYVLTSGKDAVLSVGVALTGTADRQFCGACAAGLHGFHLPPAASEDTGRLYAKVENITWRSEFAKAGHFGGHTDAVNSRFVRQYVAPLLWPDGPRFLDAGLQPEPN